MTDLECIRWLGGGSRVISQERYNRVGEYICVGGFKGMPEWVG